jgi:site-specific DNA recombinase
MIAAIYARKSTDHAPESRAGPRRRGGVYGYNNRRIGDHIERVVNPGQADVVRRIFGEIAEGRGFTRVAKAFTAEGIPSPHPGRGWAATAVLEMVFRDLYPGQQVYGKTRWERRAGTKRKIQVPEAEWSVVETPALRIVDETLWRLHMGAWTGRARSTCGARTANCGAGRRRVSRPSTCSPGSWCAVRAVARCTPRSGPVSAAPPSSTIVCRTHRVRGDLLCANAMSAPMGPRDGDVLATFERDVLTADVIDAVVRRAVELERTHPDDAAAQREALRGRLRQLDAEHGRFMEAVRQWGPMGSLGAELRTLELRRAEILAQLEHLDGMEKAAGAWDAQAVVGNSTRCSTSGKPCSAGSRCRPARSCGS